MPKFKVGDKVRVVSNEYDMEDITVGDTYLIVEPGVSYPADPDDLYIENDVGYKVLMFEEELELVKENDMTKHVAMIANSTGCTVVIGTDIHTIANDHVNCEAIQEAYAEGRVDDLETLISVRKAIEVFSEGTGVRIEGSKLFYGDRELKSGLAQRIVRLMREGKEGFAKPLVAFMENLMQNPSYRAVEGLYEWLERSQLPITPDGHFIAWKIVDNDFKDLRTRSFDNSPGKIVEIPRNQVDEDPDRTCSYGLHFCSNDYLPQYGGFYGGNRSQSKVVMVKVNPRDVGAFPHDYNVSKGRCCRYEVLSEVTSGDIERVTKETRTGSGLYKETQKKVAKVETRGDRAEITLVFTDGTKQNTKNRLGDTTSWEQTGKTVKLLPSGRTITIN